MKHSRWTAANFRYNVNDLAGVSLGALALVLWVITVARANFLAMGGLGLVSVLGWTYFVGLVAVVVGFAFELYRPPIRSRRLTFLLVILVIFIFGTAPAIEPVASLTDAWVHAGFIQYFIQHGVPLENYDARFSWPGAFSLGAVMVAFVGKANAYGFLRWFPLFIEMSYLAPLLVIARFSGVGRRAGYLGVALFYTNNWIFQDYFSPQGLNYLFFLVVIACVLAGWQPARRAVAASRGPWVERIVQSRAVFTPARLDGRDASGAWSAPRTLSLLALVVLVVLASAMSHQLTPYAIVLALTACVVTRRLGRPELVLISGVLAVGWLSLGASNYWVGHLGVIFGSAGSIGSTIGSNVTNRIIGNASHLFIVKLRILITLGLYGLAGVGFLRRATDSRALEALAGAPFLLVAAQSYGGEGLLRVVLYGLPFTTLLAASAILPKRNGTVRPLLRAFHPSGTTLRIVTIVAVGAFALTTSIVRGGNDAYESFTIGELSAVNYVYSHVHFGQSIETVTPFLPFGQQKVGQVSINAVAGGTAPPYASVRQDFAQLLPAYALLSHSQENWGVLVGGYPPGWESSLQRFLIADGYVVVRRWDTAVVLKLDNSAPRALYNAQSLFPLPSTGPCAGRTSQMVNLVLTCGS